MAIELFKLISDGNLGKLREALAADPGLANSGISCNADGSGKMGHPLHRLCDAVFAKKITDEQAVDIAKLFVEFGANIDGYKSSRDNNTPLIAAASLHAEKLGIFYISQGADIFYAANDGATALHWAAYCGRDKLVDELIEKGANINQADTAFNSTPTGWAIHALISNDSSNRHHQLVCVKLLLKAGADKTLLNVDAMKYLQDIARRDPDLKR